VYGLGKFAVKRPADVLAVLRWLDRVGAVLGRPGGCYTGGNRGGLSVSNDGTMTS